MHADITLNMTPQHKAPTMTIIKKKCSRPPSKTAIAAAFCDGVCVFDMNAIEPQRYQSIDDLIATDGQANGLEAGKIIWYKIAPDDTVMDHPHDPAVHVAGRPCCTP